MAEQNERTRVDQLKTRLKNHPVVAVIVVVGTVVVALAALTDATRKIVDFVRSLGLTSAFVIEGAVIPEYGAGAPTDIRVTLFWAVYYPRPVENPSGAGVSTWDVILAGGDTAFQDSNIATVDPSTGRLTYKITLERPPDDTMMTDLDGVKLGVGYIGAFSDTNQNGVYDSDEEIIAMASDRAVTYLKGDIRSVAIPSEGSQRQERLWTLQQLPQGYSLTKAVSPETHGLPVAYDDLVPTALEPISLIIPKDKLEVRVPHWLSGLWTIPDRRP
jgi:hypothetical protein